MEKLDFGEIFGRYNEASKLRNLRPESLIEQGLNLVDTEELCAQAELLGGNVYDLEHLETRDFELDDQCAVKLVGKRHVNSASEHPWFPACLMHASLKAGDDLIGDMTMGAHMTGYLEIFHHEVVDRFRRQGMASILLSAMDGFGKRYVDRNQQIDGALHVDVGQLDILCFYYNRGFRPSADEDQERFDNVVNARGSLRISGPYIFYENRRELDVRQVGPKRGHIIHMSRAFDA